MKSFGKMLTVFLIFFVGTLSLIHVDRQSGQMSLWEDTFTQMLENYIEK